MGQHDVAVKFSDLKFMTEPHRATTTSSTTTTTTTGSATTTTPATTTTTTASAPKNYPEYAVLAGATKDSLKALPAFKY
jgi:hypothetical protein